MFFNTFFSYSQRSEVEIGEPHVKDSQLPDVWIVSSFMMYKFDLPLLKKNLDSEPHYRSKVWGL